MRESFISSGEDERTDNYDEVCDNWRKIYLSMDKEELKGRFHLESDEQAMYITFFHEKYRLDHKSGMLTLSHDPDRKLLFSTVISIYNLFYYSKPGAKASGEFVPFRQVKRASPFAPAFQKKTVDFLAGTFDGHMEELREACIRLGGTPLEQGDVGYQISVFDCFSVEVFFWDGDEEFAAQANILFDSNITEFLHEETVSCIGTSLVERLIEESGIGQERQAEETIC